MGLDIAAVDLGGFGNPALFGQSRKNACPYTAAAPTVPTIVDGGRRTILRSAISPAPTAFEHVNAPRNHPPVINPSGSRLVLGKVRLNGHPCYVAQPKK